MAAFAALMIPHLRIMPTHKTLQILAAPDLPCCARGKFVPGNLKA